MQLEYLPTWVFVTQFSNRLYEKKLLSLGLTPDFETGIKTPFKQPVVGIVPVTGCLVSFEYGYGYNK